jgi:hypothetical protein
MDHVIIKILGLAIVSGATYLASRYQRTFGFLVWRLGVSPLVDEPLSAYYWRVSKYWFSATTYAGLLLILADKIGYFSHYRYSDEWFDFVAPCILIWGYAYSGYMCAKHILHRRREAHRRRAP